MITITLSKIGLSVQFVRTRQRSLQYEDWVTSVRDLMSVMYGNPEFVDGVPPVNEEELRVDRAIAIANSNDFVPYFFGKTWLLLKTTKGRPLYISDNPISLKNTYDHTPLGSLGLAVQGIEVYMPLSKTLSLAMWCPSLEAELNRGMDMVNFLSKTNSGLLNSLPGLGSFEELMKGIRTGSAVPLTSENLLNLNSLQVIFSSRFLFSSKNDFSVAEKMIDLHPAAREGPKLVVYPNPDSLRSGNSPE
jgi:hypothetical protein